jgi:TolB-like protein
LAVHRGDVSNANSYWEIGIVDVCNKVFDIELKDHWLTMESQRSQHRPKQRDCRWSNRHEATMRLPTEKNKAEAGMKRVLYPCTRLKIRGILDSMPTEEAEGRAARRQLDRILASPGFARNERLSRFLRFVVERHLEGRDSELKESLVAIEVFGRPPDYDPKQDPIVRTEASRLRARLSEYYLGGGKDDPVVIEVPRGAYVPVLREVGPEARTGGTAQLSELAPQKRYGTRWVWRAAGVVVPLAVLAGAGWWRFQHQTAPIPIAVLPLINLNQDPASDYFADGLTGEIIRNLSIIDGLTVRSESSSFAFKGKPQKARDAGKQLEADYLVEGSVLRSGQQLRINVQLVRAGDDSPMWSGRYDRELKDIFAIQDEISRGIVNNLRLKLGRGRRRYETSTEAYDLYLRGRAWRGRVRDTDQQISLFEEAIQKDPTFAPAYAGLAVAYVVRSGNSNFDAPEEVAKLRAAAQKAVELDPVSAESYEALGAAYAREAQWGQAEKSFRHAMEIQPNRVESHGYFAEYYLLPLGRVDAAIRELRIAEKSAPTFRTFLDDALEDAGRDQEALVVCETDSNRACGWGARVRLGGAADLIRIHEADPTKVPATPLGCAFARVGRREEAEKLAPQQAGGSGGMEIYACLGDKDRVFDALERAASLGPIRIGWFLLRVDREHRGLLGGDPRLKALRKKVGLPE